MPAYAGMTNYDTVSLREGRRAEKNVNGIYWASILNFVVDIFPSWFMMMAIYQGPAMMKFIVALYLSFFSFASVL